MARARNIKPGFFTNADLIECDPLARLLFAGLWCEADRRGILEDRPKTLKIKILPGDNCDVEALLAELETWGFIQRYEADGVRCILIRNFEKHQNPHYKELPSALPAPLGYVDEVVSFGVPEARRQEIFARDGRKCRRCGSTEHLSLDHIIPRSRGGSEDDDNLQTLCMTCNASKNNRLASDQITSSGQRRPDVDPNSALDSPASRADPLLPITDSRTASAAATSHAHRPAPAKESPLLPKNGASYATTLNGALPKLESLFQELDKDLFTPAWLSGVLVDAERAIGPLSRDQLGRGLNVALKQMRNKMAGTPPTSPRPYARKLIVDYLTEQRDDHHAA